MSPNASNRMRASSSVSAGSGGRRVIMRLTVSSPDAMTEKLTPSLIEFPADDPERALRFWSGLLGVALEPRAGGEGRGWQSREVTPTVGVPARGQGPGDSFSLPYFEVDDMQKALEQVKALGGSIVHPGEP